MTGETLLHRQINPNWVQNTTISSQAFLSEVDISSQSFTPTEKDEDLLSVYNGEKFTAEESYIHYRKNYPSIGVLSVNVTEVYSIDKLSCVENNDPFDGHSIINYTEVESKNQIKKKAKLLRNLAVARGWTHKE